MIVKHSHSMSIPIEFTMIIKKYISANMSDVFLNYTNCVRSWNALMVWVYVLSFCVEFIFNFLTRTQSTCLIWSIPKRQLERANHSNRSNYIKERRTFKNSLLCSFLAPFFCITKVSFAMLILIFTIKLGHKIDPRTAIEDILVLQQAKTLEMLVIIA